MIEDHFVIHCFVRAVLWSIGYYISFTLQ